MTRVQPGRDDTAADEVAVLTCPRCGSGSEERMPENACVVRWSCPSCGAELRPRTGDCCVFCSYGSRPCSPLQRNGRC